MTKRTEAQRQAAAHKREQRNREIRVARRANAAEAIGDLTAGMEVYVLTFGQFSLSDALEHILDQTGPANVDLSTWTAAHADLDRAAATMERAGIQRLRFMVDTSFINRQPGYVRRMRDLFGDDCIRTLRSHAKFAAIYNDRWKIALRTSMNLNHNPRLENMEISDDPALCGFLVDLTDQIFDEHKPGDFQAHLPNLERSAEVKTGLIGEHYKPATTAATLNAKPPSTGKPNA